MHSDAEAVLMTCRQHGAAAVRHSRHTLRLRYQMAGVADYFGFQILHDREPALIRKLSEAAL